MSGCVLRKKGRTMIAASSACGMDAEALKGQRARMCIQGEPYSTRKLQARWQYQTLQAGRGRTLVCNTNPGI